MINLENVIEQLPVFDTFCSVDKLNALVEECQADERFTIDVPGTSGQGEPIYHVQFGQGATTVLIVAGPHADEPIGSLTVFSLLTLLKNSSEELLKQDIEWHIVPCIDPDGARLNEGWTQQAFTHENYMKHFHKQAYKDQADFSFPMNYKGLVFDQPTPEAQVLMKVLDRAKPDFYSTTHNGYMGGCYFVGSEDFGQPVYQAFNQLLEKYNLPLRASNQSEGITTGYAPGFFELPLIDVNYGYFEKLGIDWGLWDLGGQMSYDYLKEIKPSAVAFYSEPAYGYHPDILSEKETDIPLRQLLLRLDADSKFNKTVILEEWNKVKDDVDKTSPFYKKSKHYILKAQDHLQDFLPDFIFRTVKSLLFDSMYEGMVTERVRFTHCMLSFGFLCNDYEFVRLLKASDQTPAIKASIKRLEPLFDKALAEIDKQIDLSLYKVSDVNDLLKVQLGSWLIVLNTLLDKAKDQ